jgi:hypothetical protein
MLSPVPSVGSFMELIDLVPPPDVPVRAHGDWKRFWSATGFQPPEDYRMLMREYGAGTFSDAVSLIEPFHPARPFLENIAPACRVARAAGEPTWPDPGGLLPWATTAQGDVIGWQTVGRPELWTTLVLSPSRREIAAYAMGAVDFLLHLLVGTMPPGSDGKGASPVRVDGKPRFSPAPD